MRIESILFDNDGTLYRLLPEFKEEVIKIMVSFLSDKLQLPKEQIMEERKRLIKKYDVESTEFVFGKEYGIDYDEFVNKTYLSVPVEKYGISYDYRLRALLQNIALPKSILTNNPSPFAKKVVATLGIEDLFDNIIGSRELSSQPKPDVAAFKKAINITGYDPRKTAFVDDVPEFHRSAKLLGMTTILVGQKTNQYVYIDSIIENIYELADRLKVLRR